MNSERINNTSKKSKAQQIRLRISWDILYMKILNSKYATHAVQVIKI